MANISGRALGGGDLVTGVPGCVWGDGGVGRGKMASKPFGSKNRPFGNTKPAAAAPSISQHEMSQEKSGSIGGHQQSPMQQQPSQPPPEVLDLAVYLGIDPREDPDLLWIAEECLASELPPGWSEHTSSRGDIYFYNSETDESTPQHPLEDKYRMVYEEEKRKKLAMSAEEAEWNDSQW